VAERRIVSLIASATEIVHRLGELPHLVGRSHECDFPPEVAALPICTRPRIAVDGDSREIDRLVKLQIKNDLSVYEVLDDVLERLQPTHILTQTHCDVCAVSLRDLEASAAARLRGNPRVVALQPDSLADIYRDIHRVAEALGIAAAGEQLAEELQSDIARIAGRARAARTRPRVACVEWIEPLMAAGNWVPELVDLAGAESLFGRAGAHSPWMNWDKLIEARPDAVVVMPCGFDLRRTEIEMRWLTCRPEWSAISDRVFVTDGNQYFNRPGPRVLESLRILAEILHPEVFAPEFEEAAWRRFEGR
jgi:iron complex transport system substrate-binding protein